MEEVTNIVDINGQLSRIERKVDELIAAQQATQTEIARMQTSQTVIIDRSKEERSRISILEGNMSKAWVEIGTLQDRQKGLTAANGIFAAIAAAIAAWIGSQR